VNYLPVNLDPFAIVCISHHQAGHDPLPPNHNELCRHRIAFNIDWIPDEAVTR
jgi:hypothetical protein